MKDKKKRIGLIMSIIVAVLTLVSAFLFYKETGKVDTNKIEKAVETIVDGIETYQMSEEEVKALASTEIKEQTEEDENAQEQEVESESFELQGNIAYEGDKARTWNVELGDYKGLTYYSQLDSRWSSQPYTSTGNSSQTIGSSGCAPTTASMIVTACKGAITPDKMSRLFVDNGYRSANNGTYLSAFRAVADEFNIDYEETYQLDRAVELLRNNHYLACSCANGLFTTGGHLIAIVGIDGATLKIYDPYLYSGKFETSTRRGKVTVSGNTVYCSIENFRSYANYTRFFAYAHDGNTPVTPSQPVITNSYTRYVKANGGLNVRNNPNGSRVGGLANGTRVTVSTTEGNWSHIVAPVDGWVSSTYLSTVTNTTNNTPTSGKKYTTGKYKVTSNINVRYGAGTNYKRKTSSQLTSNARTQNKRLGGRYNGYRKGVICNVTKVKGRWGLSSSRMDLFRLLQKNINL